MFVEYVAAFLIFAVILLASKEIGRGFEKIKFPLITGFLFAGMACGPHLLGLFPEEFVNKFGFLDEIALAYIAFAAGSELYFKELRARLKHIIIITAGLVVSTLSFGTLCFYILTNYIPFTQELAALPRFAISLFCGTILIARSPSSAIAVIKELRAKGSFTQTTLGVTVIMDFVVIVIFGVVSSFAEPIFKGHSFNVGAIFVIFLDLILSVLLGGLIGYIVRSILKTSFYYWVKKAGILLLGYSVYLLSSFVGDFTNEHFFFKIFVEPLLVCMIAGFYVTNFTHFRSQFCKHIHDMGSPIYLIFFTLTGLTLSIDLLLQTWHITLILFGARMVSIFIGTFLAGELSKDPRRHNVISWMAFITQAGVGLGLAKEVSFEYPEWGASFATVMISVIVLNQIVGPSLFKFAIHFVKEDHPKKNHKEDHTVNDAVIFGLEDQSLALAKQLISHHWHVKILTRRDVDRDVLDKESVEIVRVDDFDRKSLMDIGVHTTEAIITMLSDEESYKVCDMAYEHFGTENLVVRLNDRANYDKFRELDALIVLPSTAIVSLLEHFVISPLTSSLYLGLEKKQGILEIEVSTSDFHGLHLKDVILPIDVHILSIKRRGAMLIFDADTPLKLFDVISFVGPWDHLEEVRAKFNC